MDNISLPRSSSMYSIPEVTSSKPIKITDASEYFKKCNDEGVASFIDENYDTPELCDVRFIENYLPRDICFILSDKESDSFLVPRSDLVKYFSGLKDRLTPISDENVLRLIIAHIGKLPQNDPSVSYALHFILPAILNSLSNLNEYQNNKSDKFYDFLNRYFYPLYTIFSHRNLPLSRLINLLSYNYDYVPTPVDQYILQEQVRVKSNQESNEKREREDAQKKADDIKSKLLKKINDADKKRIEASNYFYGRDQHNKTTVTKLDSYFEKLKNVDDDQIKKKCVGLDAKDSCVDLMKGLCSGDYYYDSMYDYLAKGRGTYCITASRRTIHVDKPKLATPNYVRAFVNKYRVEFVFPKCKQYSSSYSRANVADYVDYLKNNYRASSSHLHECQGSISGRYIPDFMRNIVCSESLDKTSTLKELKLFYEVTKLEGGSSNYYSIDAYQFSNLNKEQWYRDFICLYSSRDGANKNESIFGAGNGFINFIALKIEEFKKNVSSGYAIEYENYTKSADVLNKSLYEFSVLTPLPPLPVPNTTLYPPLDRNNVSLIKKLDTTSLSLWAILSFVPSLIIDLPIMKGNHYSFVTRSRAAVRFLSSLIFGSSISLKTYSAFKFVHDFSDMAQSRDKSKHKDFINPVKGSFEEFIQYLEVTGCALLLLDGAIGFLSSGIKASCQEYSFFRNHITADKYPSLYNVMINSRWDSYTNLISDFFCGVMTPLSSMYSAVYDVLVQIKIPGAAKLKTFPAFSFLFLGLVLRQGHGAHEGNSLDGSLIISQHKNTKIILILQARAIIAYEKMRNFVKKLNDLECRVGYQVGFNKLGNNFELLFLKKFISSCGYDDDDVALSFRALESIFNKGGKDFLIRGDEESPNPDYINNLEIQSLLSFISDIRYKDTSFFFCGKKGYFASNNIYNDVIVHIINMMAYVELHSMSSLQESNVEESNVQSGMYTEIDIKKMLDELDKNIIVDKSENKIFEVPEAEGVLSDIQSTNEHDCSSNQHETEQSPLLSHGDREAGTSESQECIELHTICRSGSV